MRILDLEWFTMIQSWEEPGGVQALEEPGRLPGRKDAGKFPT
jgi:hypothetical protein